MAHEDRLHALIRTMNGSEKGYFKRYAYKSERKNQRYLELFDALDKQRRYDEQALVLAFAGRAETQKLPAVKQHLYRMLLRTLLDYHSGKEPEDRMLTYIREARLLLHRGMPEAARDKWMQALRHLERYDLQEYRVVLFDVEAGLVRYTESDASKVVQLTERHQIGLDHLQESMAYRCRFSRYIELALQYGFSMVRAQQGKKAFGALLEQCKHAGEPGKEHGFQAAYSHWMSLTGIHQALGHIQPMLDAGARLLEEFEARPLFKAFRSKYYLQALNNRLNQLLLAEAFDAFDALVPKVREAIAASPKAKDRRDRRAFLENRILSRWLIQGRSTAIAEAVAEVEAQGSGFVSQPGLQVEAQWNTLLALWHLGRLEEALETLTHFREDMQQNGKKRYATDVLFLYLLLQWERGEHHHVRSSLDALRQQGRRSPLQPSLWKEAMNWFERLVAHPSGPAHEQSLQAAFEDLKASFHNDVFAHSNAFLAVLLHVGESRLHP